MAPQSPSFLCSLLSGGMAGTAVDVALFPLDTIKTRMQSPAGFRGAGGLVGVYSGLASAAAGSGPTAALFFTCYETAKVQLAAHHYHIAGVNGESPVVHMAAAIAGEACACLIRVPTENVKQKMQVGQYADTRACVRGIFVQQGGVRGFFRGFSATVAREIPFSAIQFPVYEELKRLWRRHNPDREADLAEAAVCGSIAGGVAGLATCPLDVTKTRLMLGTDRSRGMLRMMTYIYQTEGATAFMSGSGARVLWMSLGGLVFLGCYEQSKQALINVV